jgi:WD40 repeat protein
VTGSHRGREISAYEEAGNIKVWQMPSGRELRTLHGQAEGVTALAFSAQGEALASGSFDGTLILRDPARNWQTWATLRLPRGSEWKEGIHGLAFNSSSKWLAVACYGGTVELWDVKSVEKKQTLRVHQKENYGSAIAFSLDGKTLAIGAPEGTVQLWDIETLKVRKTLKTRSAGVPLAVFSPDGRMLATTAGDRDQPGKVTLWNRTTGKPSVTFTAHQKTISCLAFSSDGKLLASGSYDKAVKLWNVADLVDRKSDD